LAVSEVTRRRYALALEEFMNWRRRENHAWPRTFDGLDLLVAEFVEWGWLEGLPKNGVANVLSSLQHHAPILKKKLPEAWRRYSSWCKREVASRAAPLSAELVVGAAGWCFQQGDASMGLSLLVSFQCLLRTGELFLLQKQHIVVGADLRTAVLSLGYTKSGKRTGETEHVTLDDSRLVRLLANHLQDKEPHYLLIGRSPSQWRARFSKVMNIFDINKRANFKPYSLRQGGATHLYSTTLNLSLLTTRGRWASAPTARLYVDEAAVQLNALALDTADRTLCKTLKQSIPR
jgi:hypothetical protein